MVEMSKKWFCAARGLGGRGLYDSFLSSSEDGPDLLDFEEYIQELHFIAEPNLYEGFYQPPTEEEYHRLLDA